METLIKIYIADVLQIKIYDIYLPCWISPMAFFVLPWDGDGPLGFFGEYNW